VQLYADQLVPQTYWCPPEDVQDYADYVKAMVERYDGDGIRDADGSPRITIWQIWNEPNAWETWPGTAAEYGELLKAGYAAAKEADPDVIVAVGGLFVLDGSRKEDTFIDGLRFLDEMLEAHPDAWHAFDALAIHPYMPDVAPDQVGILDKVSLWGRIQTTRAWLESRTDSFGGDLRPIWITEIGWSTCLEDDAYCYAGLAATEPISHAYRLLSNYTDLTPGLAATFLGVSDTQQANYLVRSYAIAKALGVQHLSFHQLEDKFDGAANNFWQETSILLDIAHNYQAKKAYNAYRVLSQQLTNAYFLGFGTLHNYTYQADAINGEALYHLRFREPGNVWIDVLWRNIGDADVTLDLMDGATASLITRDGDVTPVRGTSTSFRVSERPIYLRQELPVTPTPTTTGTATSTATATPTGTPTATATPTPIPYDAYEPDDVCDVVQQHEAPVPTDGRVQQRTFHVPTDTDWFWFPVQADTAYLIESQVPPDSSVGWCSPSLATVRASRLKNSSIPLLPISACAIPPLPMVWCWCN
ncbi:MAG: hypothetical protein HC837_17925, partial [Chloroflexaceae bacterium]|nr:hypothetical protein [Chloroflexaceae bacterium]